MRGARGEVGEEGAGPGDRRSAGRDAAGKGACRAASAERRSAVPPADCRSNRQRRAGRRRQAVVGGANGAAVQQLEHHYETHRLVGGRDGRASFGAEGDRGRRCARRARGDATPPEQGVQALQQGIRCGTRTCTSTFRSGGAAETGRDRTRRKDHAGLPNPCEGRPAARAGRDARGRAGRGAAAPGRGRHLRLRPPLLLRGPQRQLRHPRAADSRA